MPPRPPRTDLPRPHNEPRPSGSGSGTPSPAPSRKELLARLQEAEQALHAIRSGEVDAIIVDGLGGEKVFTIEGGDQIYRVFVERMNEGATILNSHHIVLHCNLRFAAMLGIAMEQIIGSSLHSLVYSGDHARLGALLRQAALEPCRGEIDLQSHGGARVPVRLSLNPLEQGGTQAVCLIASDLSEVKDAERDLRASSQQLRNLAARLVKIREEERTRIAREIHDELGQSLTAVKMDLAWLSGRLPPGNEQMRTRIFTTMQLADDLIKAVRRISTDLRPGILDLGLAAAVEWQARDFQFRTGIPCQLQLPPQELALAPNIATALFRIFQETLTNVARHANPASVEVCLETQGDRMVLRIHDNGQGFDDTNPALSKSLGLLGMRERAVMLGGQVDISSTPGQGTSVTAWIPLRPAGDFPELPGIMANVTQSVMP